MGKRKNVLLILADQQRMDTVGAYGMNDICKTPNIDRLAEEGIDVAVVDCFTIKPLDADTVEAYAKKCGAVVCAENHNRNGGLYDSVLQVLAERCPVPAACVAVEDSFGEVGPQDYLQKVFGLTKEHIVEQVKSVIARKK